MDEISDYALEEIGRQVAEGYISGILDGDGKRIVWEIKMEVIDE